MNRLSIWKQLRQTRAFSIEIKHIRKCGQMSLEERLKKYPIYFDNQATTMMDPRVLDKMMPFLLQKYGNAHSKTHSYGKEAEDRVEQARTHVANLIGASSKEVVFTSGATESNNLAIKGVAQVALAEQEGKNHIITVQTEHKCVLETCRFLSTKGFDVTFLPVQKNGLIDLAKFEAAIKPTTLLASVMAVNNEIGVMQPLKEIGQICRNKGVYFHSDCAQGLGKIPLNVDEMNIDLMSMSGHKIYGPKGIGGLYIRRRPRVKIDCQMNGGGQERGFRSGTLAVPLIVGFGEACKIAKSEMQSDYNHVSSLHALFKEGLFSKLTHISVNGDPERRYPGNLNVSFSGVEGEGLLL